MGMITIGVQGSFTKKEQKVFSALNFGHAQAVADAIQYLSSEVLPLAIANDHQCQEEKVSPAISFGRTK